MAADHAERHWSDTPEVARCLKAAVTIGSTGDMTWAGPLQVFQSIPNEFISLIRPRLVLGRLEQFYRRLPFDAPIPVEGVAASASWVGETMPTPLSSIGFAGPVFLAPTKASILVSMTEELQRFSVTGAETFISDSLVKSTVAFLDRALLDPTFAAGSGPASITHGVTPIASSGTTATAIATDLRTALRAITAAGIELTSPVIVMNTRLAAGLALLEGTSGFAFASIGVGAGSIGNVPVLVSNAVRDTTAGATIVVLEASELLVADDGNLSVESSGEAALQMRNDPVTGAAQLVSMWQTNSIAVRLNREINWTMARSGAVQLITGIAL